MLDHVNYNGELFHPDTPLFSGSNRSFRYGDGIFESIRMMDGKCPFLGLHFQRLSKGMEHLKLIMPQRFSVNLIENEIKKIARQSLNARIRLTVFRKDGGLYLPENNAPDFLIEGLSLDSSQFELNSKGIKAGVAENSMPSSTLSNLKTNNALPYILAKLEAQENGFDELILFNEEGGIIEGTSSNIFVIKNGQVYTPPLSEGCVDGVMRHFIIQNEEKLNVRVSKTPITLNAMMQADEIWLTNAVKGIQWVSGIGEQVFDNKLATQAIQALNDLVRQLTG